MWIRIRTRFRIEILIIAFSLQALALPARAQMPPNYDEFIAQYQADVVINNVEWNGTGTWIAAATAAGVRIYDNTFTLLASLLTAQNVESVSWNPHEPRFVTAQGSTAVVYRWDESAQQIVPERTLTAQHPLRVALWSPGGQYIAAVGIELRSGGYVENWPFAVIYIWETQTWRQANFFSTIHPILETSQLTNRFVWEPDGAPLLAGVGLSENLGDISRGENSDKVIYLINVLTGSETRIPLINPPYSYGYSLDWQPGGTFIAVGTDIAAQVYNVDTLQPVDIVGLYEYTEVVAWDPSGHYLAGGRSLSEFSADTGDQVMGTIQRNSIIRDFEWHPNGYLMLRLDTINRLSLFDARTIDGFEVIPAQPTITPGFTRTHTPTPIPTSTHTRTLTPP